MFDLTDVMAALHDPLVAILGLFVLGGLAAQLLFRTHPVGRAVVRVVFLLLLTVAFLRAGIVPYRPLQTTGAPLLDVAHGLLKVAWWLWAAWFVVAVLRAVFSINRPLHETRLVQDLLAGVVYLAALFAIIAYVLDLPIRGLLATSGVVAIILGLALQSTLSDVFSGVILSFSRPYSAGDWINVEGGTEGRVIEINWRATHILTGRRDLAVIPNSTIAKSRIVNVSSPSGVHGVTTAVQLDAAAPPATGMQVLEQAMLNCPLVLSVPAPMVVTKSVTAFFTEFEMTFFVEDLASSAQAQNEVFDLIFRHAVSLGVRFAAPPNVAWIERVRDFAAAERKTRPEAILDLVALFDGATPEECSLIAGKLKPIHYDKDATLVEPGAILQSLYIIGAGVVSVRREGNGAGFEVIRLGPADHYGEIGMLTNAAAAVTFTALTAVTVYELAKEDLAPILKARPQVAQALSHALAQRQAASRLTAPAELADAASTSRLTAWFLDRLRRLHGVANVG